MHDDRAVGEAERLEDRDLFALHRQQAREHRVDHERGHAEEHDRKTDGEGLQHANLIAHANMGRMVLAPVRAASAVRLQQTVQRGDHRALTEPPGASVNVTALNAP